MEKSLEKYKFFPYIAWFLVIGFAVFVFMLAKQVQDNSVRLETLINERQTLEQPAKAQAVE